LQGIGDNGFGPNYIITAPDEGIPFEAGGLKPFWIGFIILALLIVLCGLGVAYLFLTQKEPERPAFQPRVHEATVAPPKEPTPRRKTPTPSQQSSQSDEAVAVMHYTDAQEAEKEKSQSATPPVNDATGSQGRHFHFRYINEGEDEK
jgi:cytoskeletal protein RodZ